MAPESGPGSMSDLLSLLTITFIPIFTRIINPWYRKRRTMRLHGCQEPVKYPHTDRLFGSDLLKLRKQAIREGRLKMLYLEHHRALGETWQETAGSTVRIQTIAAENLRFIYALHMSKFPRDTNLSLAEIQLMGKGIITTEGHEWRQQRKLIMPTFSKYEKSTMPMLEEHVDRFLRNVPKDASTFDAQKLFKRLMLDVASDFLFGTPLGMQLPSKQSEAESFLRTFDSALLGMNKRRQDFSLTSIKLWFDSSYAADVAKVHAFIDAQVQAALARTSLGQSAGFNRKHESPTSNRYIMADEMARQIRDPELLRGALLQCFLPGRDQPVILLSNTLFELSRHPEHWLRLREVAVALPQEELLSFQALSSLHPIRHAILESLRLHGPGGPNRRVAVEDVVLPVGGGPDGKSPLFVPKGALTQTHLPVLHRSKEYWGEDADEYRPQRFEEMERSRGQSATADVFGWEFKPFLAGPRTCPAKDQVMVQLTYVMVRLLCEFRAIECRDEEKRFVEMVRLTTESANGAKVALVPADD